MATAIRKYGAASNPNISKLRRRDANGQLVTPQNTQVIPIAAANGIFTCVIVANATPKVAPIKRDGTISPP